jgi:predicted DsbA family dithiol-disulfide isomerase
VLLTEHLPHINWEEMYDGLQVSGAQYGIEFGRVKILSNSRMVLEAGEFARDHGKFELFHEEAFRSYFTDVKNIGNIDVIMEIAENSGLDSAELQQSLDKEQYLSRLKDVTLQARRNGINSAPAFIIENETVITGAQPVDVFRDVLSRIQKKI